MLGDASQDKQALEDNLRFSQWEEEDEGEEEEEEESDEGIGTSSKGKSDMEQPNDQIFESPLKKHKKKREKLSIVKRVSTSTKMQGVEVKTRATKLKLGK
jgi:hypothetical protein